MLHEFSEDLVLKKGSSFKGQEEEAVKPTLQFCTPSISSCSGRTVEVSIINDECPLMPLMKREEEQRLRREKVEDGYKLESCKSLTLMTLSCFTSACASLFTCAYSYNYSCNYFNPLSTFSSDHCHLSIHPSHAFKMAGKPASSYSPPKTLHEC